MMDLLRCQRGAPYPLLLTVPPLPSQLPPYVLPTPARLSVSKARDFIIFISFDTCFLRFDDASVSPRNYSPTLVYIRPGSLIIIYIICIIFIIIIIIIDYNYCTK